MSDSALTPDHQKLPESHAPAPSPLPISGTTPPPPGLMPVAGVIGAGVPLRRRAGQEQPTESQGPVTDELRRHRGEAPGLPDPLRAGLEEMSGLDLSDVRVRYNSPEPSRHHALALTTGSDIEVGPGQERHLAHEGWHVVQQKLGRVRASLLAKGAPRNVDPELEREADMMGERAAALARGRHPGGRPDADSRAGLRRVPIASPTLQLKGEKEFNKDPSAFLESNQVLVAFREGVNETYKLAPDVLRHIADNQRSVAEREFAKADSLREKRTRDAENGIVHERDPYDIPIARAVSEAEGATKPDTIKRKVDTFLLQLMDAAMTEGTCEWFTLAPRAVREGWFGTRTQYIVTPALEMMSTDIGDDVMTPGPDGRPIPLRQALQALRRKERPDAYIRAAFIPYETNPNNVRADTSVDVPVDGDIKVAFTAAMNGCSLAIKKKSPTELTVWHFPSPDSNAQTWDTFKGTNKIGDTYDWNEYNSLSDSERDDRNHETTTVMIRDGEGWKIKSQQNVGPANGDQRTELLKVGKIFERRLRVGEQATAEIHGGTLETVDH